MPFDAAEKPARAAWCSAPIWATAGRRYTKDGQFYYDAAAGDRAVRWIEQHCVHTTGEWAGRPFVLERWQRQIVRKLFGWMRADGFRKHRIAFIAVPRKNGKTTLCAAIALYLMIADGEPRASIYSIAGNEAQARIVFKEATLMARFSDRLREHVEALETSLYYGATVSSLQPLRGKKSKSHGLNPHGVIGDEVHEWDGRDQYDAMVSAVGARRQPLQLFITTAGHDKKTLCAEMWRDAERAKSGEIDLPHWFVRIYAAREDDDWSDEVVWRKANPNYGISVKPEFLRDEYAKAKDSAADEVRFRQLYLNQWTESEVRLISVAKWRACALKFDPKDLIGAECYGGLDIGVVDDFSAMALKFEAPNKVSETQSVWLWRYWAPEESIAKRARRSSLPIREWVRDGFLIPTPGDATDFRFIRQDIIDFVAPFAPKAIGYDPWLCRDLAQYLEEDALPMVEVRPTVANLGVPTGEFVRAIVKQDMAHTDDPVTRWMAGNVIAKPNATGVFTPDKQKSTDKIDGIAAAVTAEALSLDLKPETPTNIYEQLAQMSEQERAQYLT